MAEVKRNAQRERRIERDILVETYSAEDDAMAWYNYVEEKLHFPFRATCIAERVISPLRQGDRVEVVGLAPERECWHEMFVEIPWDGRRLGVPLSQLKPAVKTDKDTKQAIADWQYWAEHEYML